ncbi:hypothetical protein Tco_1439332 [Tanacetum coccineum]
MYASDVGLLWTMVKDHTVTKENWKLCVKVEHMWKQQHPNGKLTHDGLEHAYMFVALCLPIASCNQEHLKGIALDPWIPALEQGEQRSKGSTCKDIYFLPLQRYQPSSETPRSRLFDLIKKEKESKELKLTGERIS